MSYDLVVIGAGPGGYVCAIKAAQLGLKVACVEKHTRLGGTCLNVGCIPSKALLHSSHLYHQAAHGLSDYGIRTEGVSVDLPAMLANKDNVVTSLTGGIAFLFKKNKVDHLVGTGRILSAGEVAVTVEDGTESVLETKNICIATGSSSIDLPGIETDEKQIVSSTGVLDLESVPEHLVVVGGGYIGLEMATVWQRLGANVTVVEFLDAITPGLDAEIAKNFHRILKKQGINFRLGTKVTSADKTADGLAITVEPAKGGDAETIDADIMLVAIGRRPHTEGLGLDAAGVALDDRGRVMVDGQFATNIPGIFAIGDVIAGPMLAHKAEEEGVALAEMLAGQKPHVNYDAIPAVVYTHPEVASVGKTEEQLKADGMSYNVGKFPFTANSRAKSIGETDGFVKLLADSETDRLLGAHIIGSEAGTMIAELALALEFGASSEDVARTCHPHPTFEEAVKEAALGVFAKPIHM